MPDSCLIFLDPAPGYDEERFRRRRDAVTAWFAPVGSVREAADGMTWWLEPPPASLRSPAAVLDAGPRELRSAHTGLLVAKDGTRTRLVTGACGPSPLYEARGPDGAVYATHAVAAALLATGSAAIDGEVLPELLALGSILGDRSLIAGVRPVPPATVVDLGRRTWCYRDLGDRWPEMDPAAAKELLLESLDERLRAAGPWLGLTAGLDSGVVAVAAAELGVALPGFTWDHAVRDATGAAALAGRLGMHHERVAPTWHDDELGWLGPETRWNEGLAGGAQFAQPGWPDSLRTFVTGGGGEVGRAFWWGAVGRNHTHPDQRALEASFRPDRLLPTPAAAGVRERVGEALTTIAEAGVTGWRVLDVLYAEQRVRHWGRGMLARGPEATIAAFASQDLLACLASQPVDDRLGAAFHRSLLDQADSTVTQRAHVPAALRRAASRLRRRRPGGDAWLAQALAARPVYREWLADALAAPEVADAFGPAWGRAAAESVRAARTAPLTDLAVRLSGPLRLRQELATA
jgi:hypothetical protein